MKFYAGLFQETLPNFLNDNSIDLKGKKNVIHLDADIYSATLYALMLLSPKLKPNDVLIFDEFSYPNLDEFRAYYNFLESSYIKCSYIAATQGFAQTAFKVNGVLVN